MAADVAVIVLAAGFGTRLARDLAAAAATAATTGAAPAHDWAALQRLPKPLLPVWAGRPLLDEWVDALLDCRARDVSVGPLFIVANAAHHAQFVAWAGRHGIPPAHVLNDGSATNETRLGAIADLHLALKTFADEIGSRDVLVLAGDTLFHDSFHLPTFLGGRQRDGDHVLYYRVQDDAEVSKRGIVEVDPATSRVTAFLEKPAPTATASRWACPAFYVLRSSSVALVAKYVDTARQHGDASRDMLDAPGQLIGWLHKQTTVYGSRIDGRYDIGSLGDYEVAVKPGMLIERAFARAGLIGNPSDGFNGKTISVALRNFFATVRIQPSARVEIVSNVRYDSATFASLEDLASRTAVFGYYGGVRLLRATCKRFFDLVQAGDASLAGRVLLRNFALAYDSNIPFAVGLAGSSAIVTAALRALMRFYGVTLADLRLPREQLPNVVLAIEREELGINAGLQDRVIQEYEGAVYMDFSKDVLERNKGAGAYKQLDCADMPPLYLAYMVKAGGDSGKIHSDVRRRWDAGDAAVVAAMHDFARITDEAAEALRARDYARLGTLMDFNFDLRRTIYGDAVTGEDNIRFADAARALGFSAKFTGSGGAFVLLRRPAAGPLLLSAADEAVARARFAETGFAFTRIELQERAAPLLWRDA